MGSTEKRPCRGVHSGSRKPWAPLQASDCLPSQSLAVSQPTARSEVTHRLSLCKQRPAGGLRRAADSAVPAWGGTRGGTKPPAVQEPEAENGQLSHCPQPPGLRVLPRPTREDALSRPLLSRTRDLHVLVRMPLQHRELPKVKELTRKHTPHWHQRGKLSP